MRGARNDIPGLFSARRKLDKRLRAARHRGASPEALSGRLSAREDLSRALINRGYGQPSRTRLFSIHDRLLWLDADAP